MPRRLLSRDLSINTSRLRLVLWFRRWSRTAMLRFSTISDFSFTKYLDCVGLITIKPSEYRFIRNYYPDIEFRDRYMNICRRLKHSQTPRSSIRNINPKNRLIRRTYSWQRRIQNLITKYFRTLCDFGISIEHRWTTENARTLSYARNVWSVRTTNKTGWDFVWNSFGKYSSWGVRKNKIFAKSS